MKREDCLFERWRALAPPLLHTSAFWPSFNDTAVQTFVEGNAESVTLSRPANVAAVHKAQQKIQTFLEAIQNSDAPCRSAYEAFERERLATLELVLSAHDQNAAARLNDVLYGTAEELRQGVVIAYLKKHVEALEPRSPLVAKSRERLLDVWHGVDGADALSPIFNALEQWRLALRPLVATQYKAMQTLLKDYDNAAPFDAETTRDILQKALQRLLGKSDWRAITQPDIPNAFIDYTRRAVVLPADKRYEMSHVQTLIMHEIGVHVQRSQNGQRSREPLAAFGLAGYGPLEEAFGVLVGSAHMPAFSFLPSLVPVAMADFAACTRSFRTVWELTKALLICLDNGGQKDYDRIAFSRAIRMLRFGTGDFCERSATKYWRGLLLLNDLFAQNGCTPASFNDFFLGKYDPVQPSQRRLLQKHI